MTLKYKIEMTIAMKISMAIYGYRLVVNNKYVHVAGQS
jgi:hypothetical protein